MKLPDTNLWLALSEQDEPDAICFCRSIQPSFLRLLTTTGVMSAYGIQPLHAISEQLAQRDSEVGDRVGWAMVQEEGFTTRINMPSSVGRLLMAE